MNLQYLTFKKSKQFYRGLFFFLGVSLCLGMNLASAFADITTIRIQDQLEVENEEVLLGQIASIDVSLRECCFSDA